MEFELIEAAERELARLEAERSALPGLMAQAARGADVEGLRGAKHRASEIADEIFVAKARMLRLQLNAEERRHSELQAELSTHNTALVVITDECQRLQDIANAKLTERGGLMLRVMALEAAIENARETVSELQASINHEVARASGKQAGEQQERFGLGGQKMFSPGSEAT